MLLREQIPNVVGKLVVLRPDELGDSIWNQSMRYGFKDSRRSEFGKWIRCNTIMLATNYDKYHCTIECLIDNEAVWFSYEYIELAVDE
jgi:hypothetical protein